MKHGQKIFVTGHRGMVGSAILRLLSKNGFTNLLTAERSKLDLRDQMAVRGFFRSERPDVVILAAAKVGGIEANRKAPAEFLFDNLAIQNNIFESSRAFDVQKLIFLGSSCIYPAACPQPMKEEYLLTGPLEPTNEGYALAKIAGLKLAEYLYREYKFQSISLMPCNIYGTNDHFDLARSHVLSALVRRFIDAADQHSPRVELWGTGIARREFMHVNDLAEAVLFLSDKISGGEFLNVGVGTDISIRDLASLVAKKAGFEGEIAWDSSRPDGMLRKCLDVSKLYDLGFRAHVSLEQGIEMTIAEYKALKERGVIQ